MSSPTQRPDAPPEFERYFMKVPEFARLAAISRSFAFRLVSSGDVPSIRIGKSVRIPVEAARAWAAQLVEAGRLPFDDDDPGDGRVSVRKAG